MRPGSITGPTSIFDCTVDGLIPVIDDSCIFQSSQKHCLCADGDKHTHAYGLPWIIVKPYGGSTMLGKYNSQPYGIAVEIHPFTL